MSTKATSAAWRLLTRRLRSSIAAVCVGGVATICMAQSGPTLTALAGSAVLNGESPRLIAAGLAPGEKVVLHSFRRASVQGSLVIAHARAEFAADKAGRVDVERGASSGGTYVGVDPLGLLWSGIAGTLEANLEPREVLFRLERDAEPEVVVAEVRIQLTDGLDRVEVQDVRVEGLNGAFARPKNAAAKVRLPTIILLHGSEGGTMASARAAAIRFAQLGYAAFGLNYFAYPYAGLQGTPQALTNIPVETVGTVRKWLQGQKDVDASRVALWGASKGAELALIAASHYDWIERVVACVPSSVVWPGFGRAPVGSEILSSWTIQGKPLSFIPYDRYEDALQGRLSAAFVHQRSLDAASKDQTAAARIPIERSRAKLLLMGASRDQVWPSALMTRQMEEKVRRTGGGGRVQAIVFEGASHFICGTGTEMTRINPVVNPEGDSPSPDATAAAAARAWAETKALLARP